jgi:ribosomal protein L11 methylase PrmA
MILKYHSASTFNYHLKIMHYRYKIKNHSHLNACKRFLKSCNAIGIYEIEEKKALIVGCFFDGELENPPYAELLSKETANINWEEQWDHQEVLVSLGPASFKLKPGSGFGDASHPTTLLCLDALKEKKSHCVIDIGSGSGILSIAAYFLGAKKIISCEIDDSAIAHHKENCQLNQIPEQPVKILLESKDLIEDDQFFIMNMILSEQKEVFRSCPDLLKAKGTWYVSGILKESVESARDFYEELGFKIQKIDEKGIWSGIWMTRS